MRGIVLGLMLLMIVPISSGQSVNAFCDVVVGDDGGVLNGPQITAIDTASVQLMNQGADVKVRTVGPVINLDVTEREYERQCTSWQGANGGRKNTLLVLMVSPFSHKLGIYYGSAWRSALDAHWNRIKTDYMVPKFRDKDWAGGFIATETQLAARLVAAKDESLHPAVSTTTITHQATDLSGLWIAFEIGMLLLAAGLVIWGLYQLFTRKGKIAEAIAAAQQSAIIKRNAATDRINRYKDEVTTVTQGAYDLAVENFSRLMNSERTNPDTMGLSEEQYNNIRDLYWNVCRDLDLVIRPAGTITGRTTTVREPAIQNVRPPKHRHAAASSSSPRPSAPSYGGTTIVAPVIVDEHVDETPSTEPSIYTHEEPSTSTDDSSDGGSSSYSSSTDSDSGGGSSIFSDSLSSNDSGGGGGFDFGGGGDSGGGGSSDF